MIADIGLINAKEDVAGPVRLPYTPGLRRPIVKGGVAIRVGKRDMSNAFCLFVRSV